MRKESFLAGLGLFGQREAEKKHAAAVKRLQKKMNPQPKQALKIVRDGSVKVIVIYSGKGGVGKTTTTANMARTLVAQGHKVAVIDGDVNTPSMAVVFKKDSPVDGLLVCTMGYEPSVFVQTSKIREFFRKSTVAVNAFKPDYLLIDTPPSITDVHIGLLETFKPSGLVLVTQPTELSWEDVSRTVWLFEQRGVPILGVVRSMVTAKSPPTKTAFPILANIKFHTSFDGAVVLDKNQAEYNRLVKAVENVTAVVLENRKRVLFDETPIDLDAELQKKGFKLQFINVSSWAKILEALIDREDEVFGIFPMGGGESPDGGYIPRFHHDRFLDECTPERVERLVKAFEFDEEAYFMVVNPPNTEIPLITGEIGRCRLRQIPGYYNVPVVDYHTKEGVITLFPFEVMPATQEMIGDCTKHNGRLLPDGRYLPGLGTVMELYQCYGDRVGLLDNWPIKYLHWIDAYTPEEREFLSDFLQPEEAVNTEV